MSTRNRDPRVVWVKRVRMPFANLATARATVEGGKEKFSATFLMDPATEEGKASIRACNAAVKAAIEQTFEGKDPKQILASIKDPKRIVFRKGEEFTNVEGEVYGGFEGKYAVSTTNSRRPRLFDRHKRPVETSDIEDVCYRGVYCDALISFYAVKDADKGGRGLFCTVEAVRSHQEGERMGGGVDVDDYFNELEDLGDDDLEDDLTGGSKGSDDEDDDLL